MRSIRPSVSNRNADVHRKVPDVSHDKIHNISSVRISNPEEWKRKLDKLKADGIDELHIVSDWDRTLTRASTADRKDQSTYSLIINKNYLDEGFNRRSQALFDTYRHIETSPDILENEKIVKMRQWWSKQYELLVAYGFNRRIIERIIEEDKLRMREGVWDFFDILDRHDIPLLILSAGIKNVIEAYLEARNRLTKNVHIIANTLILDAEGRARDYEKPLIHSLNKNEERAKQSGYYREIVHRRNVLLLGDTLEDVRMGDGIDHTCMIRFGFLNDSTEATLEQYASAYDAVIYNDGTLDIVNSLLKKWCHT